MTFLAVVAWTNANRIAKYQDYPTEVEAVAHVARVIEKFPDAFVAPYPGSGPRDWLVDPIAKTLSVVIPASVLIESKADKRQEFKDEGVRRIVLQVPEWDNLEIVAFVVSISNLLTLANINAAQALARDIYLYVRDTALSKLDTISTKAELDAIDPTVADPFGDGTPWPK